MKRPLPFYVGLFLITFTTLVMEVTLTRVFSVLTWYYLGFFAISIAMLGMTTGALYVYLRPQKFTPELTPAALSFYSLLFAVSLPLSHFLVISTLPGSLSILEDPMQLISLLLMSAYSSIPFFLSGVVVTLCLTRIDLPTGRVYAVDLLGAALGCLGSIVLLNHMDPTSAIFLLGSGAAIAALCFDRSRDVRLTTRWAHLLAFALLVISLGNLAAYPNLFRLHQSKHMPVNRDLPVDRWNFHSRILGKPLKYGAPSYWAASKNPPDVIVPRMVLNIDGEAGTVMTHYNGNGSLEWIKHDVTSVGHFLRAKDANVAVIGVGGGRDILSALAFDCAHVTGIEFNKIFLDLLEEDYRDDAGLADDPRVELLHHEGRSYIESRESEFDLIQMSLIDTWASTSAGAMTLSENGLYTAEAWSAVLRALKPEGMFTVSRWYGPSAPVETVRVVGLAVQVLLDNGMENPADHIALVTREKVATLLLSKSPFPPEEIELLKTVCAEKGFEIQAAPGVETGIKEIVDVLAATTTEELLAATDHPYLTLFPPTDSNPFFFNVLKPTLWFVRSDITNSIGGVIAGNLIATDTLMGLIMAILFLDLLVVFVPLFIKRGVLKLPRKTLIASIAYFMLIGLGFMLVELSLMQRFTVLLGHPVYSLSIVLFSVILASGAGSLLSDRLFIKRDSRVFVPAICVMLLTITAVLTLPAVLSAGISAPLPIRGLIVLLFTIPAGLLMGCFFPLGISLLREHNEDALPWMWGINGGFSVLGGSLAPILSMALSIDTVLLIGGACYLTLLPAIALLRKKL